jgi:DNA primase
MKTEKFTKASWGASSKRKYLYASISGIALIALIGGYFLYNKLHLVNLPKQVSLTSSSALAVATKPTTAEPLFYKKEQVYKRVLAESENSSIRTSEVSTGYTTLSVIPPAAVAPQVSVRMPQFPNSSDLNNYQALSTLGTQQYYSNLNVQQYLHNMSTQQYLTDMSNQQYLNNLNTQQYLNNTSTWENQTTLNAQQYLNNLTTQQSMNNLTNQQYLNNFNNLNTQQTLNNINNNINNQQYLNNFNNLNTQQTLNNMNTFTNPTFNQPMPQIYNPPPVYNPPPSFNFP